MSPSVDDPLEKEAAAEEPSSASVLPPAPPHMATFRLFLLLSFAFSAPIHAIRLSSYTVGSECDDFISSSATLHRHQPSAAASSSSPLRHAYSLRNNTLQLTCAELSSLALRRILALEARRVDLIVATKLGAAAAATSRATAAAASAATTGVISGNSIGTGNYVVEVKLGTPPKPLLLVIDSGSDLAWTQCKPCTSCYAQHDPLFNPSASSSYAAATCSSALCRTVAAKTASKCSSSGTCIYGIEYLDGSFTIGTLATDTLSVGTASISSFPIGCGSDNEGLFQGFDGLIGLSRDSVALPAQSKSASIAYCLPSPFAASAAGFLQLGASGGAAAAALVDTATDSFYTVNLNRAIVGGKTVAAAPKTGTVIIDSGTVITRLQEALYTAVRDEFKKGTASLPAAAAGAGLGLFDTCYKLKVGQTVNVPAVTLDFGGGLLFTPPAASLFYPVDDSGTVCFAFAPLTGSSTKGAISILGNYQQQHYRVAFNIAGRSVTMQPGAC